MKKLAYYFIASVVLLAGASVLSAKAPVLWAKRSIVPSALADDDEEEEREDDEEGRGSESSSSSKPKTETVTTYVKLPDQIIKRLITTTIYDSDGDGIFDPDDSTPNIHNIFVVEDKNLNGVADRYEDKK